MIGKKLPVSMHLSASQISNISKVAKLHVTNKPDKTENVSPPIHQLRRPKVPPSELLDKVHHTEITQATKDSTGPQKSAEKKENQGKANKSFDGVSNSLKQPEKSNSANNAITFMKQPEKCNFADSATMKHEKNNFTDNPVAYAKHPKKPERHNVINSSTPLKQPEKHNFADSTFTFKPEKSNFAVKPITSVKQPEKDNSANDSTTFMKELVTNNFADSPTTFVKQTKAFDILTPTSREIIKAMEDPSNVSLSTLTDLARFTVECVVENTKYIDKAVDFCIAVVKKETNRIFIEYLIKTCIQFQRRDNILRGKKIEGGTRFTAFILFLTKLSVEFKKHKLWNRLQNAQVLSILVSCIHTCVSLPIREIMEVKCLIPVLPLIGPDIENKLPTEFQEFTYNMTDALLSSGISPEVRRNLLHLFELQKSNWKLSESAERYYAGES